jgi:hypothetical protein
MVERGRTSPKPAPIPNGDVRLAVRLLNDLVTYQESIAETHSFPDGSVGDDPRDRYIVADAKRQAGYARGLVEWLRVRLTP